MDFLQSGLFWLFFVLLGVSLLIFDFGHRGRLPMTEKRILMLIGGAGLWIIPILAFVFMWWQGGVAILVSGLIWAIISLIVQRLLRARYYRRYDRLLEKEVDIIVSKIESQPRQQKARKERDS
jgi:membrane-bound ClpP family serine protease